MKIVRSMQGGQRKFLTDYVELTWSMETKWKQLLPNPKTHRLQVPEIMVGATGFEPVTSCV